jgi:GAF domain-containing protein
MTQVVDTAATDPWQTIADLQRKLDEARAELAERDSQYGERIEQQSATIDVLKVMSASPGDPQPVFDLITRRARDLCNANAAALYGFDGELVHFLAATAFRTPGIEATFLRQFPMAPTRGGSFGRAILDRQIAHIRDADADPELAQPMRDLGMKSLVGVPLSRDGAVIGALSMNANEPGGFSDAQIALLQTFAEQAVIAITSAETYRQLQQRTGDLQESLEYQTATSDVLKVISRSTFDLQPVLDALVETAARLCQAEMALIFRREGELHRLVANFGFPAEHETFLRERGANVPDPHTVTGRAALESRVVHVQDVAADPSYPPNTVRRSKMRTALAMPLLREGEPIGVLSLARQRVEAFTERQIELVRTFADQAVIAMENARLLGELQQRTGDLQESLEYRPRPATCSRSSAGLPPISSPCSRRSSRPPHDSARPTPQTSRAAKATVIEW